MDEIIKYFSNGGNFFNIFVAISFIVVLVRAIERFGKWVIGHLNSFYNKKRGIEKKDETIDIHTKEIQKLTDSISALTGTINEQYNRLNDKIDEQQKRLETIEEEGKTRDCAIFRDRIIQSHRYFSQRRNEEGIVYISLTDFENLQHLFKEYFGAGGNDVVHQIYEQDFLKNFRVDNKQYK